jgi:hypothetical protein
MTFSGEPLSSTQYAAQVNHALGFATDGVAKLFAVPFSGTIGEDGVGTINLVQLPGGRVRVLPALSYLDWADHEANSNLSIGHRAYIDSNGDSQDADADEWITQIDVGGGRKTGLWNAIAAGSEDSFLIPQEKDAPSGLIIYATIDTGDTDTGDTYFGVVVFMYRP